MDSGHSENPAIPVAFLLSQVGARSAQEFSKLLKPLNLEPPDAGILRLLGREPGISQQELARRLGMHASRLVAIVDAMEERKLVVRETNANDRRSNALRLSNRGRETLSAISGVAREHEKTICAPLADEERRHLAGLLRKLSEGLGLASGIHPGYRTLGRAKDKPKSD